MHDACCAAHRFGQATRIEKIPPEKREIPVSAGRCDKFRHPGAQIVITDNHVALAQQPVDQIASDESGCPCDKSAHLKIRLLGE
jgi:hypothetical protein